MTAEAIVTLIGNGTAGCAADGDRGTAAAIAEPFGLAMGPDGCLYLCDLGNHRVCRVDLATGAVATVAGTGRPGYAGDGGPACEATLLEPYEIRFNSAGDLYVVDMPNHVVRCVSRTSGRISTIAGTGRAGYAGDGGPAAQARLRQPHSIEIGADGAVFVADIGNHRIRRIDPSSGVIDTFAGTGEAAPTIDGAAALHTPLHGPRALAFDETGDLLLALREGNAVYRIDMDAGTVHHVAGTGRAGYAGDGGDAKRADLAGPKGICATQSAIYIADTESHTIRRIDGATNRIDTVVGDGSRHDGADGDPLRCGLARPHGVCAAAGRVFVGDSENHRVRALAAA